METLKLISYTRSGVEGGRWGVEEHLSQARRPGSREHTVLESQGKRKHTHCSGYTHNGGQNQLLTWVTTGSLELYTSKTSCH